MDSLPEEILSHIAAYTNATTILNLSRTSRKIRSACLDAVVLKSVIQLSQLEDWRSDSLDLASLASSAQHNPQLWLRFALANEKAWGLNSRECPLESPEDFMRYMPCLMVLRHPFMYHSCWRRFMRDGLNQSPAQLACLVIGILAKPEVMPQLGKSLRMQEDEYLCNNTDRKAYLWALCSLILYLRTSLKIRFAVWPFQNAQRIPYIEPPTALEVLSHVDRVSTTLPVPFSATQSLDPSQQAKQILNDDWNTWFSNCSSNMATHDFLCTGSWTGYYTNAIGEQAWIDPPMTSIQFRPTTGLPAGFTTCPLTGVPLQPLMPETRDSDQQEKLRLQAVQCVDGVEVFDLTAEVHKDRSNHEIKFYARKQYYNTTLGWDWDCRLTPFGIHGFWGLWEPTIGGLDRKGMIWLWRADWTQNRGKIVT